MLCLRGALWATAWGGTLRGRASSMRAQYQPAMGGSSMLPCLVVTAALIGTSYCTCRGHLGALPPKLKPGA